MKFLVAFFLIFITPTSAAQDSFHAKPSYENVFTRDIYDQRATLQRLQPRIEARTIADQEVDQELCVALHTAKQKCLDASILKQIRTRIEIYQQESETSGQRSLWGGILKDVSFSIGGVLKALGNLILGSHYSSQDAARIAREIGLLRANANFLREGLTKELVHDFERSYVKKKRRIQNTELEHEIEQTLIDARKSDHLEVVHRNFLERALRLPTGPRRITEDAIQRFREDPFFQAFPPETRAQFELIINNLMYASQVCASQAMEPSSVPVREVCCFWGGPSGGKSSAAQKLAKIVGAPCYEVTLRDASELARTNLEGNDRYHFNAEVGWIVQPLLTPDPVTLQTFSNAVLVINDFDRVLFSPSKGSTALSFLLDYLDPRTRVIKHPYFKAFINIAWLTIIITVNKKIPEGKGDAEDVYAPLRDRVRQVEFPGFDPAAKSQILNSHLQAACSFYQIPTTYRLTYVDGQIEIQSKSRSIEPLRLAHCDTIRNTQRAIDDAVSGFKLKLRDDALNHIKQEQQAALQEARDGNIDAAVLRVKSLQEKPALIKESAKKKDPVACYLLSQWFQKFGKLPHIRKYLFTVVQDESCREGKIYQPISQAIYVLGEEFEYKHGLSLSNESAVECFRAAAGRDHARSQFKMGWLHLQAKKFSAAKGWFEKAAELGDSYAINYLGVMHGRGLGVREDQGKGLTLYQKAIKLKENVFTLFNVGYRASFDAQNAQFATECAAKLRGLVQPILEGFGDYCRQQGRQTTFRDYFRTRPENEFFGMDGDVCALFGNMYQIGFGLDKSLEEANLWFQRSITLDNVFGKSDRINFLYTLKGADFFRFSWNWSGSFRRS